MYRYIPGKTLTVRGILSILYFYSGNKEFIWAVGFSLLR